MENNDLLLSKQLEHLNCCFPLPEGWSPPQLHHEQMEIEEDSMTLIGIISQNLAQTITGSAADFSTEAVDRAYFELLERISIVQHDSNDVALPVYSSDGSAHAWDSNCSLRNPPATSDWAYSRSNGVAIANSWSVACQKAYLELVERDRVLKSWLGGPRPKRKLGTKHCLPLSWKEAFDIQVYEFESAFPSEVSVVGVLCLPKSSQYTHGLGTAAHSDLNVAIRKASLECAQVTGFLTGEEVEVEYVPFEPSPTFHQSLYRQPQHFKKVLNWLANGHEGYGCSQSKGPTKTEPAFLNITPASLEGKLWVAKAIAPDKMPLVFGVYPPQIPPQFPWDLRVHPFA